ncbi:MAG: hypothetical protein A2Z20_12165 [Bdellovibrionales bacterium RBG_16_40_8]|nr:MAG: hypothetical protein A2Z20_12165 [Bdellovibrionales bacterium RBG_16_40_8]
MGEIIVKKEKFYYNVKLNRPDKHNAMSQKMIQELTEFFKTAGNDKFAKVIVLRGAGTSFCAGGDLAWMKSSINFKIKENMADATKLFDLFDAAAKCPLPILSYVQGNIFGGGIGLVSICDIAIAEANAKFCFSEVKIGLVPAVISSFVLQKMHINKAKELMLTGRIFNADTAHSSGLVEYVGRELEAKEQLDEILYLIGSNGPKAIRLVKRLFYNQRFMNEAQIKADSIKTIAECRVSAEGQEGLKSFLEKRKPAWAWITQEDEDEVRDRDEGE